MFEEIYSKIKDFFVKFVSVSEKDAHELAEAAVPLLNHLKAEIVGDVKAEIDNLKADLGSVEGAARDAVDALTPLLREKLAELWAEVTAGPAKPAADSGLSEVPPGTES